MHHVNEVGLAIVVAVYLFAFVWLMCLVKLGAMEAPTADERRTETPELTEGGAAPRFAARPATVRGPSNRDGNSRSRRQHVCRSKIGTV